MAVIETQKEKRDPRVIVFIAVLILGLIALGGGIYWMLKPAALRQVKLTGEQAKQAETTFEAPVGNLPAQPPIPQAQDPGPTLVNLELKQVTPRQALAELSKQANVKLNAVGGNDNPQGFLATLMAQRIDVSIKNQPFWPAMLDLCKKGGLTPYAEWNSPNMVSFQQGNQAMGPTVSVGSAMIVLDSVTSRFDADLVGTRPPTRSLNVQLRLFVEPRVSPYRISSVATIETAVDENGTNLGRPRGMWDDRQGGNRPSNWVREVNCILNYPANAGQRIAALKGYASVTVTGKPETKTVDNPLKAKNVDTVIDGSLVRLVDLRKTGGGNSNSYYGRFAGDANSPFFKEYDRFAKIATLVDTNGKEFQSNGGGSGSRGPQTIEFYVNFSAQPGSSEPKELRITLPTQVKEIRVPFEFSDIPLPH